ncbi:hypothetical protein L915_21278, partial [Phytophthora nicotianae]
AFLSQPSRCPSTFDSDFLPDPSNTFLLSGQKKSSLWRQAPAKAKKAGRRLVGVL